MAPKLVLFLLVASALCVWTRAMPCISTTPTPSISTTPKTCSNGMVYQPNVQTNCPLTCGMSANSYFAESCKTDGHAGCECPLDMARQNNTTCVHPDNCQCKGDNQRFYSRGDVIQSSDHCLQCTCGPFGLWDCEESSDKCMPSCSVIGNTVHTFDGMTYAFTAESCSLTLFQDRTGANKIEMLTKSCGEEDSEASCFRDLRVTVDDELVGSLLVDPNGQGLIHSGNVSLKLSVHRVSQNYYVDINPAIRVNVSVDGVVQMEARTVVYKGMTYGLCGTLNGDVKYDMSSPSGSAATDDTFLSMYSDCTFPSKKSMDSAKQIP